MIRTFQYRKIGRIGASAAMLAVCWAGELPAGRCDPPAASHDGQDADTPAQTNQRVSSPEALAQWVEKLGSDDYAVREAATDQLLNAGYAARNRLLVAADSPHPEVRSRARRLLVLIDQVEFDRQLAAFAADTDGQLGLSMPGWTEFKRIVGSEPADRALFVEMQRHESELLNTVFDDDEPDSVERLTAFVTQLNNWQQRRLRSSSGGIHHSTGGISTSPPLGSCATAMLIAATTSDEADYRLVGPVCQLAMRPPLSTAAAAGTHREQVRQLLAFWISNSQSGTASVVQPKLNLMVTHELREALPWALAVAVNDPIREKLQDRFRAQAILVVGKLGTDREVAELEPLLSDESICYHRNGSHAPPTVVQLGDVALAVLMEHSGNDPAELGFANIQRDDRWLFKLATLGFQNDEQRSLVKEKWQQLRPE